EKLLALDAVAKMDTPHFRLLTILIRPSPLWWDDSKSRAAFRCAWPEERIIEADQGLKNALPALLALVESLGMARSERTDRGTLWALTTFGETCIEALS